MTTDGDKARNCITIVGRIVSGSGGRKFISVPADYAQDVSSLTSRRVLVRIEPLA
jgi:hypothetical protein